MTASPARYRARWLFPVSGPPLENATIEVASGRIAGVVAACDCRAIDLGNVALIPGLVNAHTHLELSDLPAPIAPAAPFTEWLRAVIAHRRARCANAARAARLRGSSECNALGIALAGDILPLDAPWNPEEIDDWRTVPFVEVLGLDPARVPQLIERTEAFLRAGTGQPQQRGASFRRGISPHAPYSVCRELLAALVDLARARHATLAMHVAETREELELLERARGPFRDFLLSLGVWRAAAFPGGQSLLDLLAELARAPRALLIHGNYLGMPEIAYLSKCQTVSVVYCPRTHAYFGHERHPWQELLAQGVNVALGTDSRASNPNLDLFEELQFLRNMAPMADPAMLLRMGTLHGARALGLEGELGTLCAGKRAELTVVRLSEQAGGDAYTLLFDRGARVEGRLELPVN